jgi:predicted small metal-binding protein
MARPEISMGLFGRKAETATVPANENQRDGWTVQCGPACGFMVKDHDKKETAQMVMLHMKQTHKTNLTEAEALKDAKPIKF